MTERGTWHGQGGWEVGKKIGGEYITHGMEDSAQTGGQQSKT